MPGRSGPSRVILTLRSLLVMGGLGAFLTVYNVFTSRRDVASALGPQSSSQEAFFVDAADQPDIKVFYRKLSDPQKVQVAQNIGRYTDPQLAKLCAILLGDFSADARAALTVSLTKIGKVHPDAVAKQLSQTGSFEAFGVRQALTALGPAAIPDVVGTLSVDATRPNAEDLLVAEGQKSIPIVLPLLDDSNKAVQKAAVEILGKLRADAGLEKITQMEQNAQGADRATYLGAIASIGDPKSEGLLSDTLANPAVSPTLRTQAAFGLGRIASDRSVSSLWKFAQDNDSTIRDGCLTALTLCKDKALVADGEPETLRLHVAASIRSQASDSLIRKDLANPEFQLDAIRAAVGREELTSDLFAFLSNPANQGKGQAADEAIKSLLSTSAGRTAAGRLADKPLLSGLTKRREILERPG